MKATKLLVVGLEGASMADLEAGLMLLKLAGQKQVGTQAKEFARGNPYREEIQGQPIFDGLVGPMYGGEGVVRYETSEAYKLLST